MRLFHNMRGAEDDRILIHATHEARILLTQDYDFGELAVRRREAAIGIVIVVVDSFFGALEDIAAQVVERVAKLGDELTGKLTILEARRTRQRDLV